MLPLPDVITKGLQENKNIVIASELINKVSEECNFKDFEVSVLSTVGMGNALRAGDPGGYHLSSGTINILIEIIVGL